MAALAASAALAGCRAPAPRVAHSRADGSPLAGAARPNARAEAAAQALLGEAVGDGDGDQGAARRAEAAERLSRQYPASLAAARLYRLRAEDALATESWQAADDWLTRLLFYRPDGPDFAWGRERLAAARLQLGRPAAAAELLAGAWRAATDPGQRRDLAARLAAAQRAMGDLPAALATLCRERAVANTPAADQDALGDRARDWGLEARAVPVAEALLAGARGSAEGKFLVAPLTRHLAELQAEAGQLAAGEALLAELAAAMPPGSARALAQAEVVRLRARFTVDPKAIGVVLPLSGRFQAYGERALAAVRQALPPESGLRIAAADSGGDALTAAEAVESLVLGEHVAAIIGPMFSQEAQGAALRAQALGVPILCLSHREGLTEVGDFVFRTALTVAQQARALAAVAMERMGYRRFALMYPRSRYGTDFVRAFWDEVEARRGEIRGVESYAPDQTTFREPVRRLVGRFFPMYRPEFREGVERLREEDLTVGRRRAEIIRLEKSLLPVVDFDAIILPDSGRELGLIAPALAFEDLLLSHDPRMVDRLRRATRNPDLMPVTLMGASTWNSSQTLDACEIYCEDAVFVDAYFADNPDPLMRAFVAGFRAHNGGSDPTLTEAQAFDTAALLARDLKAAPFSSRRDLRKRLVGSQAYQGLSGTLRLGDSGEVDRELFLLTIKGHAIRLLAGLPGDSRR